MAKQTINIGSSANDGQGDPLRTAMDKINDNFDEIYTAGPVSSNIRIANSTITTTNTNGNLILRGNGTGKIDVGAVGNLRITGGANGYVLTTDGTGNVAFDDVGNITFTNLSATSGNITQDLVVGGNLTVNGTTTTINTSTLDVEDKLVTIAFGAANSAVADGAGINIAGANANITYANATNSFNLNKNVIVSGNILPGANVTYSLGNVTQQWKDLYVSNNTIYINNIPLSVTTGNVLTIGGQPLLSNGSGTTISTTGNVSGGYILGNGSQLTGITSYSNSNVTTLLAAYGSNTISTTGNITSGNTITSGLASVTGNVQAGNVRTAGLISATGNITGGNLVTAGSGNIGTLTVTANANVGNLGTAGLITATGNISGNYILGNGSQLTGLSTSSISNGTSNVTIPTANGNVSITAAGGNTWTFGTGGTTQFPNSVILAPVSQSITMQSDQYSQLMWVNANVTVAPNTAVNSNFYVASNSATLDIVYRDGSSTQQQKSWLWGVDGNLTLPAGGKISEGGGLTGAIRLTPSGGANDNQALLIYPTAAGDGDHIHLTAGGGSTELYLGNDLHYVKLVDGGNVELRASTANLSAQAAWTFDTTGNIDTIQALGIKVPNGVPTDVIKTTDNQGWGAGSVGVNLPTTGGTGTGLTVDVIDGGSGYAIISVNTPGTGYLNGDVVTVTNGGMSDSFTVVIGGRNTWRFGTNGNLTAPGNVSAVGNITGAYIFGNGSQLTGLPATYGNANVVANLAALGTNPISTTGNVTAGYILGNGSQLTGIASAYGNANVVANLAALGSNPVSTTGNVTAGNVLGGANVNATTHTGTTVSVTGNVTGGNILTGGVVSATGNVSGSNLNVTGNIIDTGALSIITGSNGNIALAPNGTGIVTVSSNISATGNVTAANFIGNISITGNVTGTSANVDLVSGGYTWSFNNTGNLVLPGNTFAINYANGTAVSLGSTYGNANVVANLAALGSNPVSTTGNVTGAYILGNGSQLTGIAASYGNANVVANLAALGSNPISTTGNVTSGNILTGGLISATGNITGGNILGGANVNATTHTGTTVSVTGNITGGNVIAGGTATTGISALTAGATNTLLANTVAGFTGNVNNYTQVTFQNKNTGVDATADFILTADNGSDTVNYGDFGIINSGYDNGTPTNSLGNIVFGADTYLYSQGNVGNANQSGGNLVIGTTTAGKTVKIFAGGNTASALVANISNTGVAITGALTTTGNITTGNIIGSAANVTITANSFVTTFDTTGLVSFPGNVTVTGNLFATGTNGNVVTKFESSWTVPVGNSTQSFTVTASNTYYMWVECNIANGILVWNATGTVTNTNVPVVGEQYAWVYNGGGSPIDFTSIPDQFIGTGNTIVRSNVAPSSTTNRFDFGFNNTSGGNVIVSYGWIRIS